MRYGILSDVHSNLEALRAAIEACQKEGVERFFCIGDIVGYAANPKECIRLIQGLSPIIVAGNHDWGAAGKFELEYFNPAAKEAIRWTRDILDCKELDFLGCHKLIYAEENFVVVHGTLNRPQDFCYLETILDAAENFYELEKQICFVGHTHIPIVFVEQDVRVSCERFLSFVVEDTQKYIVNVGSVGQPRDGDPRASFVIYDSQARTIELRRLAYDFTITQEKIIQAGLPKSLAIRLSKGR